MRDRGDPINLGEWSVNSKLYRLIRTSDYKSASLVLEVCEKDSLGGASWRAIEKEAAEPLSGSNSLSHLAAVLRSS